MEISGGCLCGAVRYTASEPPVVARTCLCRRCQYLGGGGGTSNALFKSASVKVEGALSDYVTRADSGNILHCKFCTACGTPVTSQAESRPQFIVIRLGTLDDPDCIRPSATIWTSAAPSWICIAEDLPRIEGQPPLVK